MRRMRSLTLADIAAILNVPSPGDGGREITGVAMLADATPQQVSFLGSEKYLGAFATTQAAAVLVQKRVKLPPNHGKRVMLVDDADLAVATLLREFAPPIPRPPVGKHHTAFVAPSSSLGDDCHVGINVVIGDDCRVGRNCVFHAGVVIGSDVTIGDDCEFFPNVVVRERITIGSRVVIHAGAVIGSDGFGYRWNGREHQKIPQIGTVVIEDDVEIGSCVCVDRAKFAETRVGRGTKIDNLVQIAHNVVTGPHCVMAGQAGLAGSAVLGAGVVLGGQCAVRDHVTLGDGAMVAACSGAAEDVDPKTIVSGGPALPHRQTLREQAALRRLPDLLVQVRKLQEEVEQLRKAKS
jgi:UDP-3-O-[3-hydroxymyristoyl] glucosamine N-acyltransferase